ncbi:calcium-binding protein [Ramlibacter sp. PS4R-6]|uniref:calcium-binding protein n=1 Tax=Ramlibacter sp. PS4R-6 TaxID=3133438 RepID=UPI0030A0B68E
MAIDGTSANDTINGTPDDDTINGLGGHDYLTGDAGNDLINGGDGNDTLDGNGGNDSLDGGDGNDVLHGQAGNDTLNGGIGFDVASYFDAAAAVNASLATNTASDGAGGTDSLVGIERLVGSDYNDTLTGGAFDDDFTGNAGNDLIDGGTGGFDNVWYGNASAAVTVNLGTGSVTGGEGNDTLVSIEGVEGSRYADSLVGSSKDEYFRGDGSFSDSLGGADTIDGGAGFDVVDYREDPGAVSVDLSTGSAVDGRGNTDTLISIEEARGSTFADSLKGSTGLDGAAYLHFERFEGREGNDTIDGGVTSDTLNQKDGNQVSYRFASGSVTVDLKAGTATGAAGNDTLLNINEARGSFFNDTLLGSDRSDITELFEGREGNDSIDGRGGFDIVRFDNANGGITASLVTGTSSGANLGSDTFKNVEGLWGGGSDDLLVGGNAANGTVVFNGLTTGPQEFFLGGAGNDTIDGGQGYDLASYQNSTAGVTVTLNDTLDGTASDGFGGTDTLKNIEGVRGSAFDDTLTGSAAAFESFEGREGSDLIDGKGGVDRLDFFRAISGVNVDMSTGTASDGYGSTDTFSNIENVRGSRDSADVIAGNAGANGIEGLGGNDTITGGAGNDTIAAGTGVDSVDGGLGMDTLVLQAKFDTNYELEVVNATTVHITNTVTGEDVTASNIEWIQASDGERATIFDARANADSDLNDAPVFANSPAGTYLTHDFLGADTGGRVAVDSTGGYYAAGAMGAGNGSGTLEVWHFNADGTRDLDFGADGRVFTQQLGNNFNPREIAVQPDDKLVVAGWMVKNDGNLQFGLARYNTDGSLDSSFGSNGIVITAFAVDDRVRSIDFTSTGKIIAGGQTQSDFTGGSRDFVLVRYNSDGTLDNTFGTAGKATLSLGSGSAEVISTVQVLGDDSILAWGTTQNTSTGATSVVLAHFNANGSLDNTFGTSSGYTLTPLADGSINVAARSMAVQGDGKIVALGMESNGHGGQNLFVERFNADGTIDTGFNGDGDADGRVSIAVGSTQDLGWKILVQPNGKIVIDSDALSGDTQQGAIIRLNADGSLDTAFGDGGVARSPFDPPTFTAFNDITLDAGGNIVAVVGLGPNVEDPLLVDMALVRYTSTGALDTTFNVQPSSLSGKFLAAAGGPAVDLLWGTGAIYDAELFARDNYQGATLTIQRHLGAVGSDVFGGDNPLTFSGGKAFLDGQELGNVTNSGGTLSITFTQPVPQLFASGLMNLITWQNGSVSAGTTVQFDWTFNDGSGAGNASVTGTSSLSVVDGIFGTTGNDTVNGTGSDDVLYGNTGNDTLDGQGGDDLVFGDAGNDTLIGGTGNDTLAGNAGFDTFRPGAGNDSVDGGDIHDRVGYTDRNILSYKADATTGVYVDLSGIAGDGTLGQGTVHDGQGGIDTVTNVNFVVASTFDDTIVGSAAAIFEQFEGSTGNDYINGGGLRDTLNNVDGNRANFQNASAAENINLGTNSATGGDGSDTLVNITQVRGSSFTDTITGSNRTDYTESFEGMAGSDTIDGAGGFDIVRFDSAASAVNASLVSGTATTTYLNLSQVAVGTTHTLIGIEGLQGTNFNDVLTGGNAQGGVTLSDGLSEVFRGGGGNDTIDGGQGYDRVDYNTTATAGVNVTLGGTGQGTASNDGQGGTDTLFNIEAVRGSIFNDTLTGSDSGSFESFEGRDGNDTMDGKGGTDRADYFTSTVGVIVNLGTGSAQDGWGGTDTLLNIEQVRGSRDANDTLIGNAVSNRLEGQGGDDSLDGADGFDTLVGGNGNDQLLGGNGDDWVAGNAGNDSMVGGAGFDWADYVGAFGPVQVNLATGVATGDGNDTLSGFEAARGTGLDDVLTGGSADESFVGGLGNDTINGGGGTRNEVAYWDVTGSSGVTVNLADGTVTGAAGNDVLSNIQNATGSKNDDTLIGTGGDNNLNGGLGNDNITGGAGSDWTAYYDAVGGVNANLGTGVVTGGGGNDTLSGIENVNGSSSNDTLTGSADDNALRGEAGNDTLDGQGGNDYLTGGSGNDSITGGLGIDTADYFYSDTNGGINVNLATGVVTGAAGADTLVGIENVNAGNFNDVITGDLNANFIQGQGGNDSIAAGAGADQVDAGMGVDTVDGGTETDTVIVHGNFATYTVSTVGGDTRLVNAGTGEDVTIRNVEQVQFNDGLKTISQILNGGGDLLLNGTPAADSLTGGAGNDTINGLASNDTLVGNGGNDFLDGGAGTDVMIGGLGDDTYVVDATAEIANETLGGGGYDTVQVKLAAAGVYTLAAGVERGEVANSVASSITGNALNNQLFGNELANTLSGLDGNDFLSGGGGADILNGGIGNDNIEGGDGNDTINGNEGRDGMQGGAGNDSIDGGQVFDRINYNDGNTVSYEDSTGGIVMNLTGITGDGSVGQGTVTDGMGGTDVVKNVPFIIGSQHDDSITGSTALTFEMFEGLDGDDTIDGGAITDKLGALNSNRINYQFATGGVTVDLQADGDGWQHATGAAGEDLLKNFNQARGSDFDDSLYGSARADGISETFEGRAGNNLIDGRGGFDWARYTSFQAGVKVDLAEGKATLPGAVGFDTLVHIEAVQGSDFNDTLLGGNPDNGVELDDGLIEVFRGNGGNDFMDGGQGWDRADYATSVNGINVNLSTNSAIDGLGGNDTLQGIEDIRGSNFADTITGGAGDYESFEGRAGNDVINGGAGVDRVDYLTSTAGANVNLQTGAVIADGWGNADTLSGIEDVRGSQFNDTITGSAGQNFIWGLGGNDSVAAGDGDDTVVAGTGVDTVDGGIGSDTAILMGNFAAYTITRPNATDLLLVNGITGESVTVRSVENFEFADGPRSLAQVLGNSLSDFNDTFTGSEGPDLIDGKLGNDSLTGLGGNDTIIGGGGNDTMVGGQGDDTFSVDVAADQVVEVDGEGSADQVNVAFATAGTFNMATNAANVENAAVTSIGTAVVNITGNDLNNVLTGNGAINTLTGGLGNDTLDGGLGNDILVGGAGDDTYVLNVASDVVNETLGGSGSDTVKFMFAAAGTYTLTAGVENAFIGNGFAVTVTGNELDNRITGNAAINILNGGLGNDTLAGGTATGLGDTLDGGAGEDVAQMLAAWSGNYVAVRATATDTRITNTVTGEIVILRGIESVRFADDTVKTMSDLWGNNPSPLPDALVGTEEDDLIDGLAGNDTIRGLEGNDTLIGGADVDSLIGGAGNDLYVVNVAGDMISEDSVGGTDSVNVGFTAAGIYNMGTNAAWVENATVTSTGTLAVGIVGNALDNVLTGNGAGNSLTGGAGNDTIDGGLGNDSMFGGAGDDTYTVNVTTDIVNESIAGSSGTDLVRVAYTGAATYLMLGGVDNATIVTGTDGVNVTGNVLANTITGNGAKNTLLGGDGNDTIFGNGGTDSVDGGLGTGDVLVLAGVQTDYVITRPTATTTVFVKSGVTVTASGIEFVKFDDGTFDYATVVAQVGSIGADALVGTADADTLDGGVGNDTVTGLAGDDTLFGGVGNDSLVGGADSDLLDGGDGSDVYAWGKGDGTDFISQNDTVAADIDAVRLTQGGLTADDVTFTRGYHSFDDLVINIAQDEEEVDQVVVLGFFANDAIAAGTIDQVVIAATNTTFTASQIANAAMLTGNGENIFVGYNTANNMAGSSGGDWMYAGGGNDTVNADGGADIVFAGAGNDVANGGGGEDTLVGGAGNDTLDGGTGDDLLTGGAGSDTYQFGATSGNDTIRESMPALSPDQLSSGIGPVYVVSDGDAPLTGDNDVLNLNGVAAANVLAARVGDDLVLTIQGPGNTVTVEDYFANGVPTIERIAFTSGSTVWNATTIRAKVLVPTSGDDTITGYLGGDKLAGGAGNDVIDGREGSDTITGGAGIDTLTGGSGNDRFVLDTIASDSSEFDVIVDFQAGDTIALKAGVFAALGAAGTRVTLSDNLLYDNTSGQLLYDADGIGGDAAVLVAVIGTDTHPDSFGNDFLLVS